MTGADDERRLMRVREAYRRYDERGDIPADWNCGHPAFLLRLLDEARNVKVLEAERRRVAEMELVEARAEIARLRAPAGGDLVERAREVEADVCKPYGWQSLAIHERGVELIATVAAAVQREARDAAAQIADTYKAEALREQERAIDGEGRECWLWAHDTANIIGREIRALSGTAPQSGWRHKKRGSAYAEVARGELQKSGDYVLKEGDRLVTYRGTDGRVWHRYEPEFDDGRFERLRPSPPTEDATG